MPQSTTPIPGARSFDLATALEHLVAFTSTMLEEIGQSQTVDDYHLPTVDFVDLLGETQVAGLYLEDGLHLLLGVDQSPLEALRHLLDLVAELMVSGNGRAAVLSSIFEELGE